MKLNGHPRFSALLLAAIAILAISATTYAGRSSSYLMGNVDRSGSRSIPEGSKEDLSKKKVLKNGLRVKWTTATEGWVAGPAAAQEKIVYVGDSAGYMYAIDSKDGSIIWRTCVEASCPPPFPLFYGVVGSPLINGDKLFVGTLSGRMAALNAQTGQILWVNTPSVNPPDFLPIDSFWGGPIQVRNMIIYALTPNDEYGFTSFGRGAVLAVDADTGVEIWRLVLINDSDFAAGSAGAGVWNTTPVYSPELDYIFVGTGQDTNPAPGDAGSDSFFAIKATDGTIAWQTQVRTGDTWNQIIPYDPLHPTDTDIGDSPAVFKLKGRMMVAAGDKRGIFWVLDAATGQIINNAGQGLDIFAGVLPGPGLTGGFNLDSGYFKKGRNLTHFAVFADQTTSLQAILDDHINFPNGTCTGFDPSNPTGPGCPLYPDTGNLVLIKGDGSSEICRFTAPDTQFFSPLEIGGMIVVRGAQDGTLYVVDTKDCSLITSLVLPSGASGGAQLSIANGEIYTGGGYFGPTGLTAIEVNH